ncbi:TPR repeat-containing protein [Cryptosporidium andersoni]|uniref:TPR repeat-containing protein n=1 Tax=Cryptosporidium andersoni TaxID=117008 RepID=A0A1J4MR79_9CRYT|nr:TPR repeat-containing protein [Cryptosporidium andersoni]
MSSVLGNNDFLLEQCHLNSEEKYACSRHLLKLINESMELRNWHRGEKFCTILRSINPDHHECSVKWCECLFQLGDYHAVLRIVNEEYIEKLDNKIWIKIPLLIFKADSEFNIGQHTLCAETLNSTLKYIKHLEILQNLEYKEELLLKQYTTRILLLQSRIYELNNMISKVITTLEYILLKYDYLNIQAIKKIFCTYFLTKQQKINIFNKWIINIPNDFHWISDIVSLRILYDHWNQDRKFEDLFFNKKGIKFEEINKSLLYEILENIPQYVFNTCFFREHRICLLWNIGQLSTLINELSQLNPINLISQDKIIVIYVCALTECKDTGSILKLSQIVNKKAPLSAISLFIMGCYYFNQNLYSKAIHLYRKTIEKEPGFFEAYLALGHSLAMDNNYDQALAIYESLQTNWKGSYLGVFYQGIEYMRNKKLDLAYEFLKESYQLAPYDPYVLNEYGILLFNNKNFVEASSIFKQASQNCNTDHFTKRDLYYKIQANLGLSLIWSYMYTSNCTEDNILDEAINCLNRYIKVHHLKTNPSIKLGLAISLHLRAKFEEASKLYLSLMSEQYFNSQLLQLLHSICTDCNIS